MEALVCELLAGFWIVWCWMPAAEAAEHPSTPCNYLWHRYHGRSEFLERFSRQSLSCAAFWREQGNSNSSSALLGGADSAYANFCCIFAFVRTQKHTQLPLIWYFCYFSHRKKGILTYLQVSLNIRALAHHPVNSGWQGTVYLQVPAGLRWEKSKQRLLRLGGETELSFYSWMCYDTAFSYMHIYPFPPI